MKILGIGQSVIDEISVIKPDGSLASQESDAGGPVLVALLMLSKLGHDCSFISTVGRDPSGRYIENLLAGGGVDRHLVSHAHTKINAITVDSLTGHRSKHQSQVRHPSISNLQPEFLQSFDMIILDRHEPAAFYEVLRHKRPDTILVIDPSTELSDFTLTMMRAASHPIVTIETLAQLGSEQSLLGAAQQLYELCSRPLIVTLGEFGSLSFDGRIMQIIPAFAVKVVNDLGAGDVYRGAFAHAQLQNWAVAKCMRYASAAAAYQCTTTGNAAHVPTPKSIEGILDNLPYRQTDLTKLEHAYRQLRHQLTHITGVTS